MKILLKSILMLSIGFGGVAANAQDAQQRNQFSENEVRQIIDPYQNSETAMNQLNALKGFVYAAEQAKNLMRNQTLTEVDGISGVIVPCEYVDFIVGLSSSLSIYHLELPKQNVLDELGTEIAAEFEEFTQTAANIIEDAKEVDITNNCNGYKPNDKCCNANNLPNTCDDSQNDWCGTAQGSCRAGVDFCQ